MKVEVKQLTEGDSLVRDVRLAVPPHGMIVMIQTYPKWCEGGPVYCATGIIHTCGVEIVAHEVLLRERSEELGDWEVVVRLIPETEQEARLFASADVLIDRHRHEVWCYIIPQLPAEPECAVLWSAKEKA